MASEPYPLISSGRQQPSSLADILAPAPVRGHYRPNPNRFCIAGNTAILFCRTSRGQVWCVRIDKEDLVRVLKVGTWYVANFCKKSTRSIYCYTTVDHKIVYLHRFILDAPPATSGLEVDHQHRRTLDCRKSEIRLVTKSLNQRNREIFQPNKWGHRGIVASSNGQRYIARVFIMKRSKQLGTFDTPELAAEAIREFNREQGVVA